MCVQKKVLIWWYFLGINLLANLLTLQHFSGISWCGDINVHPCTFTLRNAMAHEWKCHLLCAQDKKLDSFIWFSTEFLPKNCCCLPALASRKFSKTMSKDGTLLLIGVKSPMKRCACILWPIVLCWRNSAYNYQMCVFNMEKSLCKPIKFTFMALPQ